MTGSFDQCAVPTYWEVHDRAERCGLAAVFSAALLIVGLAEPRGRSVDGLRVIGATIAHGTKVLDVAEELVAVRCQRHLTVLDALVPVVGILPWLASGTVNLLFRWRLSREGRVIKGLGDGYSSTCPRGFLSA